MIKLINRQANSAYTSAVGGKPDSNKRVGVAVVDNFEVDTMLGPGKIVDFVVIVEDIMAAVGTFLALCKNIDLQDPNIAAVAAGIVKAALRILEHLDYYIMSPYFYQINQVLQY